LRGRETEKECLRREIKEELNTMVEQLRSFAAEVTRVAREVGNRGGGVEQALADVCTEGSAAWPGLKAEMQATGRFQVETY